MDIQRDLGLKMNVRMRQHIAASGHFLFAVHFLSVPKGLRMRHQFYVALVLLLVSGIARSATIEDLPCQNGCADDCIRFNQGTVFVQTESEAKLLDEGTIYDLSRVTSRFLRRHQKNAEVAGDVQVSTWSSGATSAEVTQTVIDTTCYWRKPNGTYASAENCCGTNYRVRLKFATPKRKLILNAIFGSGC